jgi:hypothetical protein
MSIGDFIKKPNTAIEFTHDQILELDKCAADPCYFINTYCYIQNQTKGKVLFKLRPYQVRLVNALHTNTFNIVMQPRQTGKSETTAAYAYWFSIFSADKNVLIASNKQKGATDIMNRIKFMYENTPDFLRPGVSAYNRGSVEFDNGSKIWSEATTPDTGRGRSVALFILDELAHVKPRIQTEMWASILGTISAGENLACVIMSTPNGDSDLFAELWRGAEAGTNGFVHNFVANDEIPDRDKAWLATMVSKLGELKVRQEFLCEFLSSDPLLINSLRLLNMKGTPPIFTDKGFSFWREPSPQRTYLIGVDIAEGMGKDFSTIQVFELETLEQICEYRNNTIKEDQLYNAIKWIMQKILSYRDSRSGQIPTIHWSFENNSIGAVIGALYYNDEKFPDSPMLVNAKGEKLGMRTTNPTKLEACRNFKNMVEKQKSGMVINSEKLIFELKNYVQTGAGYAAKPGATDDLISACLIVSRVIKHLSEYEPKVFDKLYKSEGEFYEETSNDFDEPIPFLM